MSDSIMDGDEDLTIERLLEADFDAVQFLNDTSTVPTLSSQGAAAKLNKGSQLQTTFTDVQSQISKLNAYNARTSTELTILTDEILRSGNRLAYEVEVLRSDANSLFDLLSETLKEDIALFVGETTSAEPNNDGEIKAVNNDPEFMQQLRLLGHVKARLEEVIRVFGDALKWPIPPSDVSMASTLISVSAPELGVTSTVEDDKARATIRAYREQIVDLLNSEGGGFEGLEAAQQRIQAYQNLALIWKGTVEEKARNRVVEGFAKLADDRRKALETQSQRRSHIDSARSSAQPSRSGTPGLQSGGLLGGLRKLRDEIYLD